LASNFNNDTFLRIAGDPAATASAAPPDGANAAAAPVSDQEAPPNPDLSGSPAFVRFRSCRWQQPAENGNQEYCTHREVKPYAGTQGFDPDAWCLECQHYKLRRAPKKRGPDDYSY